MNLKYFIGIFATLLFLSNCQSDQSSETAMSSGPIFQLTDNEKTGFSFQNKLVENKLHNTLTFDYIVNGGGVGILDADNDGRPDIFMASNQSTDQLFLNKGNFKFEDITSSAGISNAKNWTNGVTIVDINNDGYDDIYLNYGLYDEEPLRKNQLFVNQKNGTFKEMADAFGIADSGYSIMSIFFDYDKDGDLDLYVGNTPPSSLYMRQQLGPGKHFQYSDNLYRNDGQTFTKVTDQAGLINYNYTLSVTVADFNKDNWPDLFIASDYDEPDIYLVNQKNGTFKNMTEKAMRHLSYFSMGSDFIDIDRDGWLDIFVADMAAEDNFRSKTNMSGMNPEKFYALAANGYHHQYMFNALHLNKGNGQFLEAAQMSGISNTDWSWAPLFFDADLDGYDDLFVTNGQYKEMRNKDFEKWRQKEIQKYKAQGMDGYDILFAVSKEVPSEKINNVMYRNKGDMTFEKKTDQWGLDGKSWSQGLAYADFDQDGDLDLVVNNLNMDAFLYRNTSVDQKKGNHINIRLTGQPGNKNGAQAKVEMTANNALYYNEMNPVRGYMSTSQSIVQFGLGDANKIEEITITWNDGKETLLQNVKVNQTLNVDYKSAKSDNDKRKKLQPLFAKKNAKMRHKENKFDDFEREILLPHRMSTLGPDIVSGDVNGDGLDDLFVCGAAGQVGRVQIQNNKGGFKKSVQKAFGRDKKYEDVGATFFDCDQDGDLDLYVVSGGNEWDKGNKNYQDRLYKNDGKGNFTKSTLPNIRISGSVALPIDFDDDGDLDLFIGGRQVPGFYGISERSILLENKKGKFTDVSEKSGKVFESLGMVTDAQWVKMSGINQLMIVGEWMPIQFFEYKKGVFEKINEIENSSGWWNDIASADLDGDGDTDFVLGNLGTNIKFKASADRPFKVFLNDFDDNGSHDIYLGYYSGDGQLFPVRGRQCSSEQMPFVKQKFESYADFGNATVDEILDGRMDGAVEKQAEMFESVVLWNKGDGKFDIVAMDNSAQVSPVNSSLIEDYNQDGFLDILSVGNNYHREVETTRSDAGSGIILLGDGQGNFEAMPSIQSGINSYLDARKVVKVNTKKGYKILVTNNNGPIDAYDILGD